MPQAIMWLLRAREPNLVSMGVGPFVAAVAPLQPVPALQIVGTTKDEDTSAIIPGASVDLFETATKAYVGTQVADANGNFAFLSAQYPTLNYAKFYQCTAYLAGAPDKAGITVNTLLPAGG